MQSIASPRISMARRFFWSLLIAALLALTIQQLNASTDECDGTDPGEACVIVYQPGMCSYLEPYGWWWYYWGCNLD